MAYLLVCVRVSAFCDGGSRNFISEILSMRHVWVSLVIGVFNVVEGPYGGYRNFMSEILSMRHASVIFGLISHRCF